MTYNVFGGTLNPALLYYDQPAPSASISRLNFNVFSHVGAEPFAAKVITPRHSNVSAKFINK